MYIKLIQPKMKKRPMDTGLKIRMSPPLGLLTIANMFRNEHRVVIANENIKAKVQILRTKNFCKTKLVII